MLAESTRAAERDCPAFYGMTGNRAWCLDDLRLHLRPNAAPRSRRGASYDSVIGFHCHGSACDLKTPICTKYTPKDCLLRFQGRADMQAGGYESELCF